MLDMKHLFKISQYLAPLYIFCTINDCSLTFPATIVLVQAAITGISSRNQQAHRQEKYIKFRRPNHIVITSS